ncbi:FtsB family cell division protein [Brytella acorum]|uniref:Septum formation initiator family protein n=1 Tax=Brytella acorum TaxID=2959299 RepID=A0AA35XWF7_9PROT|nr:septum formation initiator family protein [Brytella acorum]MDF3623894.1 septum formation initiator family protein [Brytella acorum]CAI9120810.1 septum formation initiator family protein [Brytella acorum]
MSFIRHVRRFVRSVAPSVVFLGLTAYFGWNAVHGDHGIRAYHDQLKIRDQALQAQQDANEEQIVWRRRVASLNEHALDGDMLDERTRAMLNLARSGDIVIPYKADEKLY